MPITLSLGRPSDQPSPLWGWSGLERPAPPRVPPRGQRRFGVPTALDTSVTPMQGWDVGQTLSLVSEIGALLEELEEQGVSCIQKHAIREYLLEFPDLLDVIPIAVRAAKEIFPEGQLVLGVYQDPEVDDRYLALYVRLPDYDESFLQRLEEAEAGFIDRLSNKAGWLQLTTDFRTPGTTDVF